jgi:hypothetical protein
MLAGDREMRRLALRVAVNIIKLAVILVPPSRLRFRGCTTDTRRKRRWRYDSVPAPVHRNAHLHQRQ